MEPTLPAALTWQYTPVTWKSSRCSLRLGARPSTTTISTMLPARCEVRGQFDALELLLKSGGRLDGTRGADHHGGYTPLGCAVSCRSMRGPGGSWRIARIPTESRARTGKTACTWPYISVRATRCSSCWLITGPGSTRRTSRGTRPWRGRRRRSTRRRLLFSGSCRRQGLGREEPHACWLQRLF